MIVFAFIFAICDVRAQVSSCPSTEASNFTVPQCSGEGPGGSCQQVVASFFAYCNPTEDMGSGYSCTQCASTPIGVPGFVGAFWQMTGTCEYALTQYSGNWACTNETQTGFSLVSEQYQYQTQACVNCGGGPVALEQLNHRFMVGASVGTMMFATCLTLPIGILARKRQNLSPESACKKQRTSRSPNSHVHW